jgi:hypothetical protein
MDDTAGRGAGSEGPVGFVRKQGILVFHCDAPPGLDWARLVEADREAQIRHILDPDGPMGDEPSRPHEPIS